ncbi:hypothetical protein GGF46_003257 [Coemansia sp. RSA 552]|nr:hypothetical protein GGF46_003257 [Coemansia sp. RSA 552]
MAKPRIFVIYYSTYGHVHTLAQSIAKGALKSGNVDVEEYQFAETLSDDVLEKMHAGPKPNIPTITVDKIAQADGLLIGFPTRFGSAPAQVKSFFDATGRLWSDGALQGKPVGLFFSTASQHGGQESTAFSFIPHLVHHGMLYVPLGFQSSHLFDNDTVIGGSAWGAGAIAGPDGSRQPTYQELDIAEVQGERFAQVVTKLTAEPAKEEPTPQENTAAANPPAGESDAAKEPAPIKPSSTKEPSAVRRLAAKFKRLFS